MTITEAYTLYAEPIHRYIFNRVHSHELADDLTQDTFIKAMRAWSTIRGETVRAWLYRIAHNLIIDHARHVSRVAWTQLDAAYHLSGLDEMALSDERAHIETTLAGLKPKYANALRLCLDGGNLPYAVLASRAGVAEPTFKVRVSRGRKQFAAAYEQQAEQQKGA